MPVHEVDLDLLHQRQAAGDHVVVHVRDPGDERPQLLRASGLGDPVDVRGVRSGADAVDHGQNRAPAAAQRIAEGRSDAVLHPDGGCGPGPTGQDVNVVSLGGQLGGELVDVAGEPTLHDRRVLPAEDQDAHAGRSRAGTPSRNGARLRSAEGVDPSVYSSASNDSAWAVARRSG